ncbi:hypothetical protein B0A49_01129 [Cryomyces minteri]|uniref:Nuclear distribution protein RO10 n=1 Tax=Cryomyces minteri TaxID=331657 RepID=A0A4U0XMA5_9PEZI|nr:hypothetical protein B0A49_01129 [Cryomyces minteri]
MASTASQTTLETLTFLTTRLQRAEFVLSGQASVDVQRAQEPEHQATNLSGTVTSRICHLESALQALAARSSTVAEILELHFRYPDLFHALSATTAPSTLSTSELTSIILASAPLFPTTSSRLSSIINDTPIPDAASSATLVSLQPRLTDLELRRQEEQAQEIAELRKRSAKVLERWYELSALGAGECWSEWEGRLAAVEQSVRREENARTREEGMV